jgi:hypothetical protein
MSSHRPASRGRGRVRGAGRCSTGKANVRLLAAIAAGIVAALIVLGVMNTRRVAEFAPVSVVESKEPLQELPVRTAANGDAVDPAHTYDAIIDLSRVDAIVVGVDLDYLVKGMPRYDAVIRDAEGGERFRGRIAEDYFREGRFMLRLFGNRFPAGDYTLDIEGFDTGASEGRIIASSWFQVSRG